MDMWSIAEQMYKPGASTTVKFKMEPKHDHAQKKTIHMYIYIYSDSVAAKINGM